MKHLSTTTLMAALAQEPRWSTQIEIAQVLRARRDVFNITPLCEFLIQGSNNRDVMKAVAETAAALAPGEAARWLSNRIFSEGAPDTAREAALRALAYLRQPVLTIPVLKKVAVGGFEDGVRKAAFFRLGRSGRPEAVRFLIRLEQGPDGAAARMAREALDGLVSMNGGVEGALDRMLDLAAERARRGRRLEAARLLGAAIRIGRRGGLGIEQRFRQRLVA